MKKNSEKKSLWNKYLTILFLIQVFSSLSYYSYIPLIPIIQEEFLLSNIEIGWMTSVVFLGASFIAIPSGVIADRIGVKKVLLLFILITSTAMFSFFYAANYLFILVLLFLLGIGYGGINPGTNKGVMEKFSFNNRGTAMGIKQTGVTIGSTLAALLLPIIADELDWRIAYLFISLFLIGLSLLHFIIYKEDRHEEVVKVKLLDINYRNNIFVITKNKPLFLLTLITFFFIWVQLSVSTFLVLFITESVGHSLNFGFVCLVILFIGGAFGRTLWGFISDRFFNHNRGNILGVLGLLSGSLVTALSFITINIHPLVILIMVFLLGISTQGWNGMYVLMLSEIVKPHYIGLASGFGLTFGYFGAIIGAPLSGWIVDLTGGFKVMWLLVGICVLNVGIFTFFVKFDKFLIKE